MKHLKLEMDLLRHACFAADSSTHPVVAQAVA